jgi:acetyl esterase/lipase
VPQLEDLALGNAAYSSAVQAVVDWFGPVDFLKMDEQLAASGLAPAPEFAHSGPNSPESLIMGRPIMEIPEVVRAASPATYLHTGAPPFFIQHGDRDDVVPYQQSVDFAAQARALLGPDGVKLDILPGARHADGAFVTPDNLRKVLDFLDQSLRA